MRIDTKEIERTFAKHKAEVLLEQVMPDDTKIAVVKWAVPDTGIGSMRFLIFSNHLTVLGDYGAAVYRWSSPIDLEFLAKCSFDYFVGKCEASEDGRDFEEWDSTVVEKFVNVDLKEMAEENEHLDIYEKYKKQLLEQVYSLDQWREFIQEMDFKDQRALFGNEHYEWYGVGMIPSYRAELHWHGIKKAYEYLHPVKERVMV